MHIVKSYKRTKKGNLLTYLSLQSSYRDKTGKIKTKYEMYLGPERNWNKEKLKAYLSGTTKELQ